MKINKKEKIYLKWLPLAAILNIFFLLPLLTFAQIEITEIMYNLEGDDDGPNNNQRREWLEIYNSSSEEINLNGWKLYEAETNHGIDSVPKGNSMILSAYAYAVITDKPDIFKDEYPSFLGVIFDSAFSLSDTGETLIIRDSNLVDIDKKIYSKNEGANGDGNSLQKIDGDWVPASPTPGLSNSISFSSIEDFDEPLNETEDEIIPLTQTAMVSSPTTVYKIEPQVFGTIILPQDKPIAGADFLFSARSCGLENKPLDNAEYQWTFGDGGKAKGQKVLYAYQYPGEYMVVLEVTSGKYVGSDRLKINVLPPDIAISDVNFSSVDNQFIELHNSSSYELNLSWWRLKVDNNYFTFPKDTIILPKKYLKLSSKITGLFTNLTNKINLLYPNGSIAFAYQGKEKNVIKSTSLPEKIISPPLSQTTFIQQDTELIVHPKESYQEITPEENLELISQPDLSSSTLKTEIDKSLFNKWNISLIGVVILAVGGIIVASKLDQEFLY